MEFTSWDILRNLLLAARWTVAMSVFAFISGTIVGLLVMMMRISKSNIIFRLSGMYVELFQGTPLLMQMFLLYFGTALFDVALEPWQAGGLALTLFSSAYLAEIWRGCVQAVSPGQWEASSSLAMSYLQQMRHVVVPQAIRLAVPPTVGFMVQIVKGTAVASVIGFIEVTRAGSIIVNATFRPFETYGFAALIYFCLCFPLSWFAKRLERNQRGAHSH